MAEEQKFKCSETFEDYAADEVWATEGGNLVAGDPAPPDIGAVGRGA